VAVGALDPGTDDARVCPQCHILDPLGAGHRRVASCLSPYLLGCGLSDQPPANYRYTLEAIRAQILGVLDGLSLSRVHWVGESSGGIIGLMLAAAAPDRIESLVLCNTPTRIPDAVRYAYALGQASASDAMLAKGVGAWCRQTLGHRLDLDRASEELREWVVREMDRTPAAVAAAMHECFEGADTSRLLRSIAAPVLLISGNKSPIASAQQQALAEALPNGRLEVFTGYGHGINVLLPERCARVALDFWRSLP
jgi:pimeloyl-ACP methyl ester carboxylesterase